jgi:hypothetical protein
MTTEQTVEVNGKQEAAAVPQITKKQALSGRRMPDESWADYRVRRKLVEGALKAYHRDGTLLHKSVEYVENKDSKTLKRGFTYRKEKIAVATSS